MYNILVVDDEKIERDGIRLLIEKNTLPLNIVEASNGKEAMGILKTCKIDILFTDIVMPFVDGLELAQQAESIDPEMKVIIYSAYGEFEYAQKAIDASVIHYILKPIETGEFKSVMNKVIEMCMDDQEKRKARNELEQSYQKAIAYEKEKLLIRMIYGENVKPSYSKDISRLMGCFNNKFIQMALLDFDNKFFDTNNEAFEDFIKGILSSEYYYLNLNERQSMLFLFSEEGACNKSELNEIWNRINEFITERFGLRFFTVFSNYTDRIEDLHQEYSEIERILEYKFFLEKSSVLFTENLYSSLNTPSISVENLINIINKDIDLNEYYNLEKDIELLSDYFRSKGDLSIIYVKYIFADILKRLLEKNHFDDKVEIKEHVESIFNCSSILQLKEIIQSVLKQINALITEVNEESRRWLIDDVLCIIESDHMKEIGLDYIAERINISSSYLSFIFRKETGHNLVKYINQFRLEKSKVLLRETNLKIVDVGKKVGFLNQSYFCLMFRNYYGLTPGDFRERVKLSEKTSSGF